MRKEYDFTCACGAKANFFVNVRTFNQLRVNELLRDLKLEADAWLEQHSGCKSNDAD